MKNQFKKPLIEVIEIDSDEIITTSRYGGDGDLPSDQDFDENF